MKHKELMAEVAELLEAGWRDDALARRFGLQRSTTKNWVYAYKVFGKEALLNGKKLSYSQELKLDAVRLYLDEGLTKPQVMERLGIKSKASLESWIRAYRADGAGALAPKPRGRRSKPEKPVYATREEELEARVRELELENAILKRINALADEIEQRRRLR